MENFPKSFNYVEVDAKTFRCNIKTNEEAEHWIKEYSALSRTSWNCKSMVKNPTRYISHIRKVCHHSQGWKLDPSKRKHGKSKNLFCKAELDVLVKKVTYSTMRNDKYLKDGYQTIIQFIGNHSHPIINAETLSCLPPSEEIKNKFYAYFDIGLKVGEAMRHHEARLLLEYDNCCIEMADASNNPKMHTIVYLWQKWRDSTLGPRNDCLQILKEKIPLYEETGHFIKYNQSPFALVIVTPMMKRAHSLPLTNDIVFIDSTSSCDAEGHSITFILTACSIGAIPLGVLITKGQTQSEYQAGFQLFNSVAGITPQIVMTDDSNAERGAIKSVWPESKRLLCRFHICQAIWRWLWDAKHEIIKGHRKPLYTMFHDILIAPTQEEAHKAYEYLSNNIVSKIYDRWVQHIAGYWDRRECWALAWRDEKTHGHHTNNYSEVSVRLFKDIVLQRTKAYNPIALVDFVVSELDTYYTRRLRDVSNGRCSKGRNLLIKKLAAANIQPEDIILEGDGVYKVPSSDRSQFYFIDAKIGICSCGDGKFGKFCKHQAVVYKYHDTSIPNSPPLTAQAKHEIAYLAFGEKTPPIEFFIPLPDICDSKVSVSCSSSSSVNIAPCDISIVDGDFKLNEEKEIISIDNNLNVDMKEKFGDFFLDLKNNCFALMKEVFYPDLAKKLEDGFKGVFKKVTTDHKNRIKRNSGAKIKVQPTAISRRRIGVTRGNSVVPSGRPALSNKLKIKRLKRLHNLSFNIKNNKPNGKSHGATH